MSHAPVQSVQKPATFEPPEIRPIPLHLAVVPPPEEPELPIPSPAAQPPVIKLVGTLARIPAVSWFEAGTSTGDGIDTLPAMPPAFDAIDLSDGPATTPAPELPALPLGAAAAPEPATPGAAGALPPADPLAVIMLLSEDERIALFT
jgi:hypothetical protein